MKYFEAFSDALRTEDRPRKTILFADIVDSAKLKERTAEVNWLPTIGKFLDIATNAVQREGGQVVKYLGDGVLAVFDDTGSASAIRSGIALQEELRRLQQETTLIQNCQCTVGISTGKVVEYNTPAGAIDVIGSTVDLAARLSTSAAPNAVWIDVNTFHAADMTKIGSEIGRALDRPTNEYHLAGEVGLKGFGQRVSYYEIIWAQSQFGARNETVRESIQISASPRPAPVVRAGGGPDRFQHGVVDNWSTEHGRGFIRTERGDHYVDRRFLADGQQDLTRGKNVRFLPTDPLRPGDRPVAGALAQEGWRMKGVFTKVFAERGFGFVDVQDQRGNTQSLFVHLGDAANRFRVGDRASFVVSANSRGLSGQLDEDTTSSDD
ncbi:adenylate/guanylate cyclase domain-containing protein [Streptoalloteichus hindustanus]|uniref:Adenylate cyclase, class 3 n=1 Tax=Streptoalloteichus hindustanus TaxID=2017 RepID=A0A1M4ZA74_STRHI|nr:adenylate/guanylate cyclase domain-containing protein [Streptoalloteichus hindustanus]SHF14969.1 Adenylate cyclase, class 3 [Streptoalloteichus hindustanus]